MGAGTDEGADRRFDDHELHQLPVDELLQRQRPERSQTLLVDPEGVDGRRELDEVERDPKRQGARLIREEKP